MSPAAAGRPPKSKQHLSKQAVLKVALPIVQKQGADALTFRVLADALRVTPMAVAYHCGGKRDLLADLVELAFHGTLRGVAGESPAVRARSILTAFFRRAMPNANLLRVVLEDHSLMNDELAQITEGLRLCAQELDAGDKGNVLLHLLIDYTHGFILSATSGGSNTLSEDDYLRGIDWVLAGMAREAGKQTGAQAEHPCQTSRIFDSECRVLCSKSVSLVRKF